MGMNSREENKEITYTEAELKMGEIVDSKYKFHLPVNTDKLWEIGKTMCSAVGYYSRKVLAKDCVIVVLESDGYPIVCIELSEDLKFLIQAKILNNGKPTGFEKHLVLEWMKKHNIESKTTDL